MLSFLKSSDIEEIRFKIITYYTFTTLHNLVQKIQHYFGKDKQVLVWKFELGDFLRELDQFWPELDRFWAELEHFHVWVRAPFSPN